MEQYQTNQNQELKLNLSLTIQIGFGILINEKGVTRTTAVRLSC